MQSSQVPSPEQGSPSQEEGSHCQVPQLPDSGPVLFPVEQVEVLAHQPHSMRPVQLSQLPAVLHASVVSQAKEYQSQSAQNPEVGPE